METKITCDVCGEPIPERTPYVFTASGGVHVACANGAVANAAWGKAEGGTDAAQPQDAR